MKPIFAQYFEDRYQEKSEGIIAVFETGEICSISLELVRRNYRFSDFEQARPFYEVVVESDTDTAEKLRSIFGGPRVACTPNIEVTCVAKFEPPRDLQQLKIEYINDYLIISGAIYRSRASILVFQRLAIDDFSLVLVEALSSVSDITFCQWFSSFVILPRSSLTSVVLIRHLESSSVHHGCRLIRGIFWIRALSGRFTHVISEGQSDGHLLTWNDELCPSLMFLTFDPEENGICWKGLMISCMIPCFIHHVSMDSSGNRIGFILEREKTKMICIWEIAANEVIQVNYIVENMGEVICAKWSRSICGEECEFAVSTTTGYFEVTRDGVISWVNPEYSLNTVCFGYREDAFYFGKNGELIRILYSTARSEWKVQKARAERQGPIPIMRRCLVDNIDCLDCMHLYRCANCLRPLWYPLFAAKNEYGIHECYCNAKCRKERAPILYGIYQDAVPD